MRLVDVDELGVGGAAKMCSLRSIVLVGTAYFP